MEKVVKSVKQVGDFESQYGHFYKWLLEFEDGFKGEYLSKTETQNKFIEGQTASIEVTTRDYNEALVLYATFLGFSKLYYYRSHSSRSYASQ